MRVWINAARHDVLPAGIDNASPGGRREIRANRGDDAVSAIDIAKETVLAGDDGAATD